MGCQRPGQANPLSGLVSIANASFCRRPARRRQLGRGRMDGRSPRLGAARRWLADGMGRARGIFVDEEQSAPSVTTDLAQAASCIGVPKCLKSHYKPASLSRTTTAVTLTLPLLF